MVSRCLNGIDPLVMTNIAVENGASTVDIPMKVLKTCDFPQLFVSLPEGVIHDLDDENLKVTL